MRRALWFRSLATCLALWFPLVIGEPGILHPCPMHGGVAAQTQMHHGAMARGTSGHAAMHRASSATPASPAAPVAPHHEHAGCTCITCCVASAAGVLAPDAPASTIDVTVRSVATVLPTASETPRSSATHTRPYPTGPPPHTLPG